MIPPISPNQPPFNFAAPSNSIGSIHKTFESNVQCLIKQKVGIDSPDGLVQIATAVHAIVKCSQDIEHSGGDIATINKVKACIQDTLHVLSTPNLSILQAVKEDEKEDPSSTTHLKETLEIFQTLPFAAERLIDELKLIADEVHKIHPPHRHIG